MCAKWQNSLLFLVLSIAVNLTTAVALGSKCREENCAMLFKQEYKSFRNVSILFCVYNNIFLLDDRS